MAQKCRFLARYLAVSNGVDTRYPCEKRHSFLSFPYNCPEPVLVKCSFLYINDSKSGVFRTKGVQRAVLQMAVE